MHAARPRAEWTGLLPPGEHGHSFHAVWAVVGVDDDSAVPTPARRIRGAGAATTQRCEERKRLRRRSPTSALSDVSSRLSTSSVYINIRDSKHTFHSSRSQSVHTRFTRAEISVCTYAFSLEQRSQSVHTRFTRSRDLSLYIRVSLERRSQSVHTRFTLAEISLYIRFKTRSFFPFLSGGVPSGQSVHTRFKRVDPRPRGKRSMIAAGAPRPAGVSRPPAPGVKQEPVQDQRRTPLPRAAPPAGCLPVGRRGGEGGWGWPRVEVWNLGERLTSSRAHELTSPGHAEASTPNFHKYTFLTN